MGEPVCGGVMRTGSQDDSSEPEEEPDEDSIPEIGPEEITPEASEEDVGSQDSPVYQPAAYPDGMGSTADDIIEGMTAFQEQLETRVHHLEAQNQIHQELEAQYRDIAYQTLGERDELAERLVIRDQQIVMLEGQLQLGQSSADRVGSLVHRVVARNVTLREQLERSELEMEGLHEEVAALRARCERESAHRVRMEQDLTRSERRVQMMEAEFRSGDMGTDSFDFALTTSLGRLRRRVLDQVARRELRRAVRRHRW